MTDRATVINETEYLDAREQGTGWCLCCYAFTRPETEPDAMGYDCPECGENEVYGAEEALIMGCFEFGGDREEAKH